MRKLPAFAAAALGCAVALAATPPRPPAASDPAASSAHPLKGPSLAASANRALARDAVPSARDAPPSPAEAAHAQLEADRENLKGADAARELARLHDPSTYDRDIQMGDKDHTEQLAQWKLSRAKAPLRSASSAPATPAAGAR